MTYQMTLCPAPFQSIAEGKKTIELRLLDERRKPIRVGDLICFTLEGHPEQTLLVRVAKLHIFPSFDQLYQTLPLTLCGYAEEEVAQASPKDMDQYYSREKQSQFQALGIEFSLL